MKTLPRGESRFCFGRRLRALVCGGFGLVGVVAWLPLSAQTLFLNDTFADSERLTQSLPSSAHWYLGNSGVASVSSLSGLTTNAQLTLEDIVANFTSGTGTAQSLNVGDTLTLNFTFGVTGAVDSFVSGFNRGFRVGLLNSNGAVYKDAGLYDSYYNGFAGYFAALNLKTSGAAGDGVPIALIKRSATDGTVQFANPDKTDLVGKSFLILNNAFPSVRGHPNQAS